MTHKLIVRVSNLFSPKRSKRHDVWITPFVSLTNEDLTLSEDATRKRISAWLDHYQSRMVEHHNANSRYVKRLQKIEAFWNPGTNQIQVLGSGDRSFIWKGDLEKFFKSDVLLEGA